MADEYIRKADAVDALDELRVNGLDAENGLLLLSGIAAASDTIESLEPADVVQVVHGRWIDTDSHLGYFANCSACGYQMDVHTERGYFRYCPHCGAKMDGDE